MIVTRHTDAKLINRIVNDPAVRPDIAEIQDGPLDLSAGVENPANVLLLGEHGGLFYIKLLPGIYECHTQALPAGRGRWIVRAAADAMTWMFTQTDCFEVVTRIPEDHAAARWLAIHTGMRLEFQRPDECKWRGKLQAADLYSFRIQDWAPRAQLAGKGHMFHDFLHAEAKRIGVTANPHADDPQHNNYVGITIAMIEAGHPIKAVAFYNRWALMSRHRVVQLIKTSPVTIRFDIGDLIFADGAWRVEPMDIAA